MVDFWPVLFDVGTLLGVAFILGSLCERFRQSALLGYLLAGMLLGPNALDVVSTSTEVEGLAEVGVCLLLYSLGLEFSWRRLRALGWTALGGGILQVTLTLAAIALIGGWAGLSAPTAVVVGAAFALSSTAGVLRVLMMRSEIDSVHGRHALGILLFQDLAVIPLVLVTGFLGAPASESSASPWMLGRTVLMLALMVAGVLRGLQSRRSARPLGDLFAQESRAARSLRGGRGSRSDLRGPRAGSVSCRGRVHRGHAARRISVCDTGSFRPFRAPNAARDRVFQFDRNARESGVDRRERWPHVRGNDRSSPSQGVPLCARASNHAPDRAVVDRHGAVPVPGRGVRVRHRGDVPVAP